MFWLGTLHIWPCNFDVIEVVTKIMIKNDDNSVIQRILTVTLTVLKLIGTPSRLSLCRENEIWRGPTAVAQSPQEQAPGWERQRGERKGEGEGEGEGERKGEEGEGQGGHAEQDRATRAEGPAEEHQALVSPLIQYSTLTHNSLLTTHYTQHFIICLIHYWQFSIHYIMSYDCSCVSAHPLQNVWWLFVHWTDVRFCCRVLFHPTEFTSTVITFL